MSASEPSSSAPQARLRVASLRQTGETPFSLEPKASARDDLARALGIEGIRKLRFTGTVSPRGRDSWELKGKLGATVVQACIVTLDPVNTRLDVDVERRYMPGHRFESPDAGTEIEMPEDDSLEPLGEVIDLEALMAEELTLSLPPYPRKDGVGLESAQFAEDGVAPMTDEDVKPFAGLAALKEKMDKGDTES
ncbi:DUF177 domain-containing protein [Sagittula sp. NFXS13]|uniref:YceD family protein n=1 Tax=Sagittula sp. NFXS13 TaxID=2819095 RepID=UPI0032DE61B8